MNTVCSGKLCQMCASPTPVSCQHCLTQQCGLLVQTRLPGITTLLLAIREHGNVSRPLCREIANTHQNAASDCILSTNSIFPRARADASRRRRRVVRLRLYVVGRIRASSICQAHRRSVECKSDPIELTASNYQHPVQGLAHITRRDGDTAGQNYCSFNNGSSQAKGTAFDQERIIST